MHQRLTRYATYSAPGCLDLDIWIQKIVYIGKDYYKIKVAWPYKRNPNEIILDEQTYKLPFTTFNRWKRIS